MPLAELLGYARTVVAFLLFGVAVVYIGFFDGFEGNFLPADMGWACAFHPNMNVITAGVVLAAAALIAAAGEPRTVVLARLACVAATTLIIMMAEAGKARDYLAVHHPHPDFRCKDAGAFMRQGNYDKRFGSVGLITIAFAIGGLAGRRKPSGS